MKTEMLILLSFVVGAIACWGPYVPVIHAAGGHMTPMRNFVHVGSAYGLLAIFTAIIMAGRGTNPIEWHSQGSPLGILGGLLGAGGALCIILAVTWARDHQISPAIVAPMVFCGAPIVATFIGMKMHPPKTAAEWPFYLAMFMAALGTGGVMFFRPK